MSFENVPSAVPRELRAWGLPSLAAVRQLPCPPAVDPPDPAGHWHISAKSHPAWGAPCSAPWPVLHRAGSKLLGGLRGGPGIPSSRHQGLCVVGTALISGRRGWSPDSEQTLKKCSILYVGYGFPQ